MFCIPASNPEPNPEPYSVAYTDCECDSEFDANPDRIRYSECYIVCDPERLSDHHPLDYSVIEPAADEFSDYYVIASIDTVVNHF